MNRQQQQVIQYLGEENHIFRETLGKKRLILNDSQRARLATAAMKLGKDLLRQVGAGSIRRKRWGGGLLNHYYRRAA
jgi:hypothetical protein